MHTATISARVAIALLVVRHGEGVKRRTFALKRLARCVPHIYLLKTEATKSVYAFVRLFESRLECCMCCILECGKPCLDLKLRAVLIIRIYVRTDT